MSALQQKAILIVDDVELNRAILCELFQKDYEILEAEDGLEALRLIRTHQSELAMVLLDIIMPVLDGFGVLEAMRAEHLIDQIPVILITAENSEDTALRGYGLGVSDVINKPFSPSVVRHRAENIIELYRYRFRLERIVSRQKVTLDRQAQKLERMNGAACLKQTPTSGSAHQIPHPTLTPLEEASVSKRVLWLLELEREKYRLLSEMSGDIVFNYDLQSDVIEFTENYQKIFGCDTKCHQFLQNLQQSGWIGQEEHALLQRTLKSLTPRNPKANIRLRLKTAGGGQEWFDIYVNALWDRETGLCAGYLGKIININDMKAEADHWREEAYRDPLTLLYNRKAVEELSRKLLDIPGGDPQQVVLFFVDIDNFKQLNDQIGHLYGDEILRYVGREMRCRFRSSDIVGRIGGDEFVILIKSRFSTEDICHKAEELCNIFRNAPCHKRLKQPISGSVGIACCPHDGKDFLDLLHKADMALYDAKNQGKNCYAFYDHQTCIPSVSDNRSALLEK